MRKAGKIGVVAAVIAAFTIIVIIKESDRSGGGSNTVIEGTGLPLLVDIGSDTCVPCKLMAPILEQLRSEYAGKMDVRFVDVREDAGAGKAYGVQAIPTQVFYDASGKELFRHEGFFSKADILAKWRELGTELGVDSEAATFERLVAAYVDDRPKGAVCYMCDGDIEAGSAVTVETDKGPVRLCSVHCYFIMYSCLTEDKTGLEGKVKISDAARGGLVPAAEAVYLYGAEEGTGRAWVKAFSDRADAVAERGSGGESILSYAQLMEKELSNRCGFCDRAVYPHDAAEVIVEGGVRTWGCCSHCALGVAARTGKDIEVHEKDRLTGEAITVKTFEGKLASLVPASAVAWFGQRQRADGSWGSAGCFHQGFFASAANLEKWVERNPYETGRLISISDALANKMKLSPEQIKKACKIGECAPKQ